jgi:hypothetical protein
MLGGLGQLQATEFSWDNYSGDSNWNTRINWDPYPNPPHVPGPGDTAVFDGVLAGSGVGNNVVNAPDGTQIDVLKVIDSAIVNLTIGDGTTDSRLAADSVGQDSLVIGDSYGDIAELNLYGGWLFTRHTVVGGRAFFGIFGPGSYWNTGTGEVWINGDTTSETAEIGLGWGAQIINARDVEVGSNTGSGRIIVDGNVPSVGGPYTPALWTIYEGLDIGSDSTSGFNFGEVWLQNGGRMSVGTNASIHGTSDVDSRITVTTGGELEVTGLLEIGPYGVLELRDVSSKVATGSISKTGAGASFDWTAGTLEITDEVVHVDAVAPHSVLGVGGSLNIGADQKLILSSTPIGLTTLVVGYLGPGDVTIENGGELEMSSGALIGAGSSVSGSGTLTVRNNGVAKIGGTLDVYQFGTVALAGSGSQLHSDQIALQPGASFSAGTGTLVRTNSLIGFGDDVSFAGNLQLGHAAGATTTAGHVVHDAQSLTVGQNLVVGLDKQAFLVVHEGGSVSSGRSFIAAAPGAANSGVKLSGNDANWTLHDSLYVGGDTTGAKDDGFITVENGARLEVANAVTAWNTGLVSLNDGLIVADSINLAGGILVGSGAVDLDSGLTNNGSVKPDWSGLWLTRADSSYVQTSSGTLEIILGGTDSGEFSHMLLYGSAALGGTLDVTLMKNYVPAPDDFFEILFAHAGRTGMFIDEQLPRLPGGLFFDVAYDPNAVTLFVEGLRGDYNYDGTVDAADYVVWRKMLGETGADLAADGNADQAVDNGDYGVWQTHFGQAAIGGAADNLTSPARDIIPEPTGSVLYLIAGLIFATALRGRAVPRFAIAVIAVGFVCGTFGMPVAARADIVSDFEASTEGWFKRTGGDPGSVLSRVSDGTWTLQMFDVASGLADYYSAPAKFLGNWTAQEVTALSFDYRLLAGTPGLTLDVMFYSGDSDTWRATWSSAPLASHQWNHFSVDVSQATWTHGGTGTKTWQDSLANVTALYLDAEVITGSETTRMDNFRLIVGQTLPGDFNGDCTVDAADYVVWRKNPGSIYTPDDYNMWRAQFGQTTAGPPLSGSRWVNGGASIPEPHTLYLIGVVLAVNAIARRRFHSAGALAIAVFFAFICGDVHAATIGTLADSSGKLVAWGANDFGQSAVPDGSFIAVAAGGHHTLAIRPDGTLAGWGDNGYGQVDVPVGAFRTIAGGMWHSLGIKTDGTLVGWGYDSSGAITTPLGAFTAVEAGVFHSLGLKTNGTLIGWGDDTYGQVSNVPAGVFTHIAAGEHFNLGLKTDGTLAAWGRDDAGQIANLPTGTFSSFAAGAGHGVAIRDDGHLASWGWNGWGQTNVPIGIFSAVSAGAAHSLAIRSEGSLVGWGYNGDGQNNVPPGVFVAIASGDYHNLALRARTEYDGDLLVSGSGLTANLNRTIDVAGDAIIETDVKLDNFPTVNIDGKLILRPGAAFTARGFFSAGGLELQTHFTLESNVLLNIGPLTGWGNLDLGPNSRLDVRLGQSGSYDGVVELMPFATLRFHNTGFQSARGLIAQENSNIRIEAGQSVSFRTTAPHFSDNRGRIDLLGSASLGPSQIEFLVLTNYASGTIAAHDAILRFGTLGNSGEILLTAGHNDVTGDIDNIEGRILVTGGAQVTFHDTLSQFGVLGVSKVGEIASTAIFTGAFIGRGASGGGNILLEGSFSPDLSGGGTFDTNVTFGAASNFQTYVGPGAQNVHILRDLTLGGALDVDLVADFHPVAGDAFDILDWGSLSGQFTSVALPELGEHLTWDTSRLYVDGVLSVVALDLPGDFNCNGAVDAADYVVWRKNQGGIYTPEDYNTWRTDFGESAASGSLNTTAVASATIPEPANLRIMSLVIALLIVHGCPRNVGEWIKR